MTCPGISSIRALSIIFQIVVVFAILKLFNVDEYLTNIVFGETEVDKHEFLVDSSSRYHHRVQEHHWIRESDEILKPRNPKFLHNHLNSKTDEWQSNDQEKSGVKPQEEDKNTDEKIDNENNGYNEMKDDVGIEETEEIQEDTKSHEEILKIMMDTNDDDGGDLDDDNDDDGDLGDDNDYYDDDDELDDDDDGDLDDEGSPLENPDENLVSMESQDELLSLEFNDEEPGEGETPPDGEIVEQFNDQELEEQIRLEDQLIQQDLENLNEVPADLPSPIDNSKEVKEEFEKAKESDEAKYLQDLYDLRDQEYDGDYEEDDYDDVDYDDDYYQNKDNEIDNNEAKKDREYDDKQFDEAVAKLTKTEGTQLTLEPEHDGNTDEELDSDDSDSESDDSDSLSEQEERKKDHTDDRKGEKKEERKENEEHKIRNEEKEQKNRSNEKEQKNRNNEKEQKNRNNEKEQKSRNEATERKNRNDQQEKSNIRKTVNKPEVMTPRMRRRIFRQARREAIKERAEKIAMADVTCNLQLVETIPDILRTRGYAKKLPVEHMSTFQAWQTLVDLAQSDFQIVSQWGIGRRGRGVEFYKNLAKAVTERGVNLRIVFTKKFSARTGHSPIDMKLLSPRKVQINLPIIEKKIDGKTKGIVHSKMMISDKKHFYLGSANLGTRCTTWTKEIGMMVTHCPSLASDASKLHDIYFNIKDELPTEYPKELAASYNVKKPLKIYNPADETVYKVYLGSSPKRLCADGRTDDLTAILSIIDSAERFIYIAVGEYIPMDLFKSNKMWTVIDDRLRAAAKRNVIIRFLGNDLASHRGWMRKHLINLMQLNKLSKSIKLVEAKLYRANIRRFHGSHNKILVTEKAGYLGTSNWAEDYFSTTAGLAFVFEPIVKGFNSSNKLNLRDQLELVFLRDYHSPLSYKID